MLFLKWTFRFLLAMVVLVVIAVIVLPRIVDPNDFRDEIAELARQQTGRDLELGGNLEVSVFPWLGIRTEGLTLSQPAQIGGDMISVEQAELRVKLIPLLSRRVEIDTVVLEKPTVRLITLSNGINSFSGFSSKENSQAADSSDRATAAVALVIQGLEIKDGDLLWDNQPTGERYQLEGLNISTGNLLGTQLAKLSADGTLIQGNSAQKTVFAFRGSARLDTDSLQLLARDLDVELKQSSFSSELQIDELTLDQMEGVAIKKLSLTLNQAENETILKNEIDAEIDRIDFDLSSGKIKFVTLRADIDAALKDLSDIQLSTSIPTVEFNSQSSQLSASNVTLQGEISGREVKLVVPDISANLDAQSARLGSAKLSSGDLSAVFSQLRVQQFVDKPAVSGGVLVQEFNAEKLLDDLNFDYQAADSNVLQRLKFGTQFSVDANHLALTNLQLDLDQSKLTGWFEARDFENLAVKFNLALDQLNLDKYLPQEHAASAMGGGDSISGAAALAVPMALLQGVQANGQFTAKQLISGGLQLNDIDVQVEGSDGDLKITPKAKLYQGTLGGTMEFSEAGGQSTLRIKNTIDLIDLASFLQAADVSEQLSGIGSLALDVVVTEKNGVQSNQGTITLFAKDGVLKGVDIENIINQAYSQYQSLRGEDQNAEPAPAAEEQAPKTGNSKSGDQTSFSELAGTFDLADFVLSNNDFVVKTPFVNVQGDGRIDLARENIDYLVKATILGGDEKQSSEAFRKLKGLVLPIRFSGSLFAPSYSLDYNALIKWLFRKELDQKKADYLQQKLGVEDAQSMSTSDILKQILINKVTKKSTNQAADQEPQPYDSNRSVGQPQRYENQQSEPVQNDVEQNEPQRYEPQHYEPQRYEPQTDDSSSFEGEKSPRGVPDVYADPEPNIEGDSQLSEEQQQKQDEDQAKKELVEKLLEGLFN